LSRHSIRALAVGLGVLALGIVALGVAATCRTPPQHVGDLVPLEYASSPALALVDRSARPVSGPLKRHPSNPRYFADGTGRAILLVGSHTWTNLQDQGVTHPPAPLDYDLYIDFLQRHGHNFFRLWVWEQANWFTELEGDFWTVPTIYRRTGPGVALDGKPKFDLSQFEPAFFDRLRRRATEAGRRGMYVSVMLFNGWSVGPKGRQLANPWRGHPFHRDNNVNGIDGDPDGSGAGRAVHQLRIAEITALQDRYVRRVVDTVNDLDGILYEISNESDVGSQPWQRHVVGVIQRHEATLPKQHPIGMTSEYGGGRNDDLVEGAADWVSPDAPWYTPPRWCTPVQDRPRLEHLLDRIVGARPRVYNYRFDPPPADERKVVITDTDHIYGIGGDRRWAWRSFTRGLNPIFMDIYDGSAAWHEARHLPADAPRWVSLRRNLGDMRALAAELPLHAMAPRPELASTGFCLASPSTGDYVVYVPVGGDVEVDLAGTAGALRVTWLDAARGTWVNAASVTGGGRRRLAPPVRGDVVLRLAR
jgi:hypothetical protein